MIFSFIGPYIDLSRDRLKKLFNRWHWYFGFLF